MNTLQLAALREIVQQGTVTKAARTLHRAQPTITHQIKMLEQELGVTIFQRSGRRVALTTEGEAVLNAAREMLDRAEALRDTLTRSDAQTAGHVRVGCGQMIAAHVLPRLMAEFLKMSPRVQFSVVETEAGRLLALLMEGQIDLAFGVEPPSHKHVRFLPLEKSRLYVVAAARNPLARKDAHATEDLARHTLIRFRSDTLIQRLIDPHLPAQSRAGTNTFEMDSAESVLALVRRNLGVAVLPGYVLRIMKPRGVAARPFAPEVPIVFGLSHVRRPYLSKALAAFRDFTRAAWMQ